MPRKVIIDTDPGIDDAMAIFFALQSPALDVVGLTTVFGNGPVDVTTTNALRLLEIAGRTDIPVAAGAADPIAGLYAGAVPEIHGQDALGNLFLPPPPNLPVKETAAEFLVEQIMTQPGEITLIPIAPLTNLALALRLEPRIAQNVREVVLMGGAAFVPGNMGPAAEANIWNDPEAADVVFGAGWPVTMIGLDVTHKILMPRAHVESYAAIGTPMANFVHRIMPVYLDFYCRVDDLDGMFVHDSTAVAYVIDPTLFRSESYAIRVETQGFSRGKTWPGTRGHLSAPWQGRRPVTICVDVDAARIIELERRTFRGEG